MEFPARVAVEFPVTVLVALLGYTSVEMAVAAVIGFLAAVALLALVLAVRANRRLDNHLAETLDAAGAVRSTVETLVGRLDGADEDPPTGGDGE